MCRQERHHSLVGKQRLLPVVTGGAAGHSPGCQTHLCPADDLPVGLVLGAVEYLHTGDGFHGFAINRAHNAAKGREEGEL